MDDLLLAELEPLLVENWAQGHNFVDDYVDGSNRFDQPSEALRPHFRLLTLHTVNPVGDVFYQALEVRGVKCDE